MSDSPALVGPMYQHLISSAVFFFALLFLRLVGERQIRDRYAHWPSEQRLKAIGNLRTLFLGVLLFGFVYIWSEAIKAFAVSVFAIALAVVVAMKEMILCIHGYIILLRNSTYQLGDRIEIANMRGDVVNISLLSTTILEVGPGHNGHQQTGRHISFPNSMLLVHFVFNESNYEKFTLITLSVPLSLNDDWIRAKSYLLEIAQKQCEPFLDDARRHMKELQRKRRIDLPSVEPRVIVDMPNSRDVVLQLRVPCALYLRETVEQAILSDFLTRLCKMRRALKETEAKEKKVDGAEDFHYPEEMPPEGPTSKIPIIG